MTSSQRKYEELGDYKYWIDAVALPRFTDYGPTRYRGRIHIVKLPNTERMMDEPVVISMQYPETSKSEAIGVAELELRNYVRYNTMPTMIHLAREKARRALLSLD